MSGLADIVRAGLDIANTITGDLQSAITYFAFVSRDKSDKPTYAAGALVTALVDEGLRAHRTKDGDVIMTRAHVTFLVPRQVNLRDKIVLQSGNTGPIVDSDPAPVDPATGAGYFVGVWLGV